MTPEMEEQVVTLLRARPDFTMALEELHLLLAARFLEDIGPAERLRDALTRRSGIFLVFDPSPEPWMAALESDLGDELHDLVYEAGWHTGPCVVLLRLPPSDPDPGADAVETMLDLMRTTLIDVLARSPRGSDIRGIAAEALNAAGELRRAILPER